jgi:hypothetical protein
LLFSSDRNKTKQNKRAMIYFFAHGIPGEEGVKSTDQGGVGRERVKQKRGVAWTDSLEDAHEATARIGPGK